MTVNTHFYGCGRFSLHPAHVVARRSVARPLALLVFMAALAACASPPRHYPSQTAQTYVGKPLFALEMHWSAPSSSHQTKTGREVRWEFDQYNLAGCSVTVHTDRAGIIRTVSWTRWCGPKAKKHKH